MKDWIATENELPELEQEVLMIPDDLGSDGKTVYSFVGKRSLNSDLENCWVETFGGTVVDEPLYWTTIPERPYKRPCGSGLSESKTVLAFS